MIKRNQFKRTFLMLPAVILILLLALFSSACSSSSIDGTYYYSSSSYIEIDGDEVSFKSVYIGEAYYSDGTYVGSAYLSGTGATYEYESTSTSDKYKVTITFESDSGTLVATAYYYDASTPYITFVGRTYTKN